MRLLVCGGRHFDDSMLVERELSRVHERTPVSVLIHGGLPGLGVPAESWARRNGVRLIRYPANFSIGKRGDFERDEFMLEDSRPDALLALPGGRRTREMCDHARRSGLPVLDAAGKAREMELLSVSV